MCFVDGSIDQYTSTCPMCKVFKPISQICPHKKETCRNNVSHPRHDVVYFKNAEVPMFNGCGYCKWAQTNPPASKSGFNNPGWPGCCRAPLPSEYHLIQPADWHAVSVIHRVPIPPDVKALLDTIPAMKGPFSQGAARGTAVSPGEKKPLKSAGKPSTPDGSPRSSNIAIPSKVRSGGSPQQKPSSLVCGGTRLSGGGSPGSAPAADRAMRKPTAADTPMKRIEGFRTTPPSSVRKLADEIGTLPHPPISRPALAALNLHTPSSGAGDVQPTLKRRKSTTAASTTLANPPLLRATLTPKVSTKVTPPSSKTNSLDGLVKEVKALSVSDRKKSDAVSKSSGGSLNDSSTVTSEGFTDYLSDESEAELQRQAEIRAAQLEHNRMEEEEFRAARQQLTSVGLRPPQVWRSVVNTATVGSYSRSR